MVKTDSNIDAKLDTLLERTAATNQHLKDMNGSIKRHEETFKEVFEQFHSCRKECDDGIGSNKKAIWMASGGLAVLSVIAVVLGIWSFIA